MKGRKPWWIDRFQEIKNRLEFVPISLYVEKWEKQMYAIYSEHTSCSGDIHDFIIAAFTTKEKAEAFLPKLQKFWPKEYFIILEYSPPKIDPELIEDVIWEGVEDEKVSNEGEALLQHKPVERRDNNNDLRRLLEL